MAERLGLERWQSAWLCILLLCGCAGTAFWIDALIGFRRGRAAVAARTDQSGRTRLLRGGGVSRSLGERTPGQRERERAIVATLEALPVSLWRETDGAGGSAEVCSLCLEPFAATDEIRWLPCAHGFHRKCIDHWLLLALRGRPRSCPLCKCDPVHPVPLTS